MKMLTQQEQITVLTEMELQMLTDMPATGATVTTWLGRYGTRPDTHSNFGIWARNILHYCDRLGWLVDPALLINLLEKVGERQMDPAGAQIPAIRERVIQEKPDITKFFYQGRSWDTCHLSLALPFLARGITRHTFEFFDDELARIPNAARVLIVNGPPGSGKTFTGNFLRLLVGLQSHLYGLAEADFAASSGQVQLTPDVLVGSLVKQMNVPFDRVPQRGTQRPDRWAKQLVIWLAAQAETTGKTWHLLLDNFHLRWVPTETITFIKELMAALSGQPIAWDIRDSRMGAPLRLILLGYKDTIPGQNDLIRVENIEPVTLNDLRIHFTRFYQYKNWTDTGDIENVIARYEPRLETLFPMLPIQSGGVNDEPPEEPRWAMQELAEVVLLDYENLEQKYGNP